MKNKKYISLIFALSLCFATVSNTIAQSDQITNSDIISLTKAGLNKNVIISKIQSSKSNFETSTEALIDLKNSGVDDEVVAAMLEAKKKSSSSNTDVKPQRIKDELGSLFSTLKNSVVTVWSEFGHGSGFIVDQDGLIVTNFHVIGPSKFVSVQFDDQTKVEAVILATDAERDVAVIWADISPFNEAIVAKLVDINAQPVVEEGERVIAIGSPLEQRKIMTTGVVSKVEERAIISDVNINPGNSGGPLFNSIGEVIGINTFGEDGGRGPGISGIVRIEQAQTVIKDAMAKRESIKKPSNELLPVEPKGEFPISAIKEVAAAKKFNLDPYVFEAGKFTLTLITPALKYRMATEREREAMKGRKKREEKSEIKGTFNPFQEFYGWAEYAGEYKPVLHIQAMPEIAETGGSIFGRILVGGLTGVMLPGKFKFKADFYTMKLFCGGKEVKPIQPVKIAHLQNETNRLYILKDATYSGFYTYPADAINESCGEVRVEVFSAQKPNEAQVENIKPKYINRLVQDFKPYFDMKNQGKSK